MFRFGVDVGLVVLVVAAMAWAMRRERRAARGRHALDLARARMRRCHRCDGILDGSGDGK